MSVLPAHGLCTTCVIRRGLDSLGLELGMVRSHCVGYWELNPDPLKEEPVHLTAELPHL